MSGMKCVSCGGDTRVSFTGSKYDVQWRRRWCLDPKCGDRFSTYELETTLLSKLFKRASIRYVEESGFVLKVVDTSVLPEFMAKKIVTKQAKFEEHERKRKAALEKRKKYERLDSEGVKKLMSNKKK